MNVPALKSIRIKLILLVLISALPAMGIVMYSGLENQNRVLEEAKDTVERVELNITNDIQRQVAGTRQLLATVSKVNCVQDRNASGCKQLFEALLKENPAYGNMFMADQHGNVVASTFPPFSSSVKGRKFFRDVQRTMDFSVGEYVYENIQEGPVLHFAYPVTDAKGSFRGVVSVALDLARYGRLFENVKLPEGSMLGIYDHNNIRLYRSREWEKYVGIPDSPEMTRHVRMEPEKVFMEYGVDGAKRIYAFKRYYLKDNESPYLFMRIGIPEYQVTSGIRKAFFANMALLGILAFMICVLACFLSDFLIMNRLKKILEFSRKLGGGDHSARTGLNHGGDELARVAGAIDEMALDLEIKEAERRLMLDALKRVNSELEAKVLKRTALLSETNEILLAEIEERKFAEIMLRKAQDDLRALTSRIISTGEKSRQRLSTELHDSVVQTLAAAKLRTEILKEFVNNEGKDVLSELQNFILQSIRESKLIMLEMSPPVLNELGLAPALEWLADQIDPGKVLDIKLKVGNKIPTLPHELQVLLFHSAREVLMNTVKHAKAKSAVIVISGDKYFLHISVIDDGVGFDGKVAIRPDMGSGFGLFSIQERLKHLGGNLTVESGPGKGTRVVMSVPHGPKIDYAQYFRPLPNPLF